MPKFQVFKSVGEVFSGVTRHYFELIWVARISAAIYMAASAIVTVSLGVAIGSNALGRNEVESLKSMTPTVSLLVFVMVIALVVAALAAAVQWHRFVLLVERDGPAFGQFKFGYFWTSIKISLVMIPVMFVAILLIALPFYFLAAATGAAGSVYYATFAAVLIAYVPVLIWAVRASLALPDVALGGLGSVFNAWEKTKGNGLRLLGYTVVVQGIVIIGVNLMLVAAILKPVFASVITPLAGTEEIAASLICLPLQLYAVMVSVTMLSVAYREIIGLPDAGSPAA